MRSHRFAPEEKNKENENDTDCLCGGGRSDADVVRFRRFSSRADCASQRRGYRRPKQGDAGLLVSSPLVSPSPVSPSPSLLARLSRPRALSLVVVALPTDPLTRRADRSRRGIFFSFDQRASHRGTRLNASVRAAGFVPPCALPEGSTVLTSPVRSLIGVLARSNS